MATYITLNRFTDQGIRNFRETTKRADAVRETAKKLGVTVKEIYWTLGDYDTICIFEASDEVSVAALVASIGAAGNLRTVTLRAFSKAEVTEILSKLS